MKEVCFSAESGLWISSFRSAWRGGTMNSDDLAILKFAFDNTYDIHGDQFEFGDLNAACGTAQSRIKRCLVPCPNCSTRSKTVLRKRQSRGAKYLRLTGLSRILTLNLHSNSILK